MSVLTTKIKMNRFCYQALDSKGCARPKCDALYVNTKVIARLYTKAQTISAGFKSDLISDECDSFLPGTVTQLLKGALRKTNDVHTYKLLNNFYEKAVYSYLDLEQLKSNHTAKSNSYRRYTFNNAPLVTVSLSV